MKPTVSRIVHYSGPFGEHLAAIVVKVQTPGVGPTLVDLTAFSSTPGSILSYRMIPEDQETKKEGTWHWPEREE
jgi:hypothetical protein